MLPPAELLISLAGFRQGLSPLADAAAAADMDLSGTGGETDV